MKAVCSELGKVAHKWKKIGVQLGIPYHMLKKFEKEDDPFLETVNFSLQGNAIESGVPLSWQAIVRALRDSTVEEDGVAEVIYRKYCQLRSNEKKTGLWLYF